MGEDEFRGIEIGQLLGPNPGHGPGRGIKHPYADVSLPPQRVEQFRRCYSWRDALVEAVHEGARSRRSLLLLVDRWIAEQDAPPRRVAVDWISQNICAAFFARTAALPTMRSSSRMVSGCPLLR